MAGLLAQVRSPLYNIHSAPLGMASARLQHPQQENRDSDRASCPSPLLGSGPIPWLLPCWRGLSCPPYLKELVVGEQAEEVLMSVADCSQEGGEEASLYGALPVCPQPAAVFAPCSTNRVDS